MKSKNKRSRTIKIIGGAILTLLLVFVGTSYAQHADEEEVRYEKAQVKEVKEERATEEMEMKTYEQTLKIKLLTGPETDREIETTYVTLHEKQALEEGDKIVVTPSFMEEGQWYIREPYRINGILIALAVLIIFILIVGGVRGVFAVIGLAVSIIMLATLIVPTIIQAEHPIVIGVIGTIAIAIVTYYISHGFNKKATVGLMATLLTLLFAVGISSIAIQLTSLFGMASEEAFYLQTGTSQSIDMQGLLLVGILIGTLGVLDDVTATQTMAIFQLKETNKKLTTKELYKKGMKIGKEHIASMVNTLALAYAGAALPMFILFTEVSTRPLWVIINSEPVAEELIRTVTGSIALICAVPLSTIMAAIIVSRK